MRTDIPASLIHRDPAPLLARALDEWGRRSDLWVFGYGSLMWNPGFAFSEQRPARIWGWHRALNMWSRINRGTPECPGLVCALLSGGSCVGLAFRVPRADAAEVLETLWDREMMTGIYDATWLRCHTPRGTLRALGFTLSRRSPSYTGTLSPERYREILRTSCGHYGSTLDYCRNTLVHLQRLGLRDRRLERLVALAQD